MFRPRELSINGKTQRNSPDRLVTNTDINLVILGMQSLLRYYYHSYVLATFKRNLLALSQQVKLLSSYRSVCVILTDLNSQLNSAAIQCVRQQLHLKWRIRGEGKLAVCTCARFSPSVALSSIRMVRKQYQRSARYYGGSRKILVVCHFIN